MPDHNVDPDAASPFHAGEQAVQRRAGVRERAEMMGRRMVRDFMPDQHREFFAELPFIVAGSVDPEGRPWASMLVGHPGFVAAPDPWTLRIEARHGFGDPAATNLRVGGPIGLLGIQPETRRRNRMNGIVTAVDGGGLTVRVRQSFGNCPQYIQARAPIFVADPDPVAPRVVRQEAAALTSAAIALIAAADTLFIATSASLPPGDPAGGVDVSHRGGRPGFVRVTEEHGRTVLTIPDFRGNNAFNTFGNIALDPRCGLLFVDFATGGLLTLTGTAEIVWDGAELSAFAGAQRLLRYRVDHGAAIADALPFRWTAALPAPQLAATGSWTDISSPA
ncbi:pyridoxamine 5'-phosphate oxidase family protein [Desertibaculum subflavum]|uniref:pyridoxamine 5'-phosphate oxidase family protein n=1 Tax=Desertibaculum subflavum TaxID=2268458 RepID=UPI000E671F52